MAEKEDETYAVERIGRSVTTFTVTANSKAEALRKVKAGEGEAVDTITEGRGWGRVWRER